MLFLLDMEYAGALERIYASVFQDHDELLQNFAFCTALISARLENVDGAHSLAAVADTANAGFSGQAETSGEARIDRYESTVE